MEFWNRRRDGREVEQNKLIRALARLGKLVISALWETTCVFQGSVRVVFSV